MTTEGGAERTSEGRAGAVAWLYLVVLGTGVFLIEGPIALGAVLVAQYVLALALGVPAAELVRATRKLGTFFAVLVASYVLFVESWMEGVWLCVRILTIIVASLAARGKPESRRLFEGLKVLRVPDSVALPLTISLDIVTDEGGKRGGGGGRGKGRGSGGGGRVEGIKNIIREGPTLILRPLGRLLRRADRALGAYGLSEDVRHDARLIIAVSALTMITRFLKVAPGLPVAPGHKGIILIPLFLYAAHAAKTRWGGTRAGAVIAVISFLFGEGRFGIFEMAKHIVAGFAADLLLPFYRREKPPIWRLAVIGVLVAAARFTTMVLVTWLAGAPAEFWALIGTIGATHVVFGALSGPVSRALLAVDVDALLKESEPEEARTETPAETSVETSAQVPVEPAELQRRGGGGGGGGGGGRNRRSDN